jgi:N utilization substance protein B
MSRHRSRHRAVQVLYQCDLRGITASEAIRDYYGGLYSEENEDRPERDLFMEDLVEGATAGREEIDRRIGQFSENWKIGRMPAVDRNILRLATYELLQRKLPPAVVIDEAMQLARRFSGDDSLPFMNGVLDAVRKEVES